MLLWQSFEQPVLHLTGVREKLQCKQQCNIPPRPVSKESSLDDVGFYLAVVCVLTANGLYRQRLRHYGSVSLKHMPA